MRLFIAEKPSLARAIAAALPLPQRRYREHIQCGGSDVVAWCVGHILEPVMPEHYNRRYARWAVGDLPIVPKDWRLRASVPALVSSLRVLVRAAARVVHAGDPDREGQLLVDEVLEFLGYRGPVDRILIRDMSLDAVRRQLGALEPNDRYRSLGVAALARQRADWLYGINMTRLYSLLGQGAGSRRVLSIGRVQTPVLGLVVARDRSIEGFRPTPYFVVSATVGAGAGAGRATVPVRWEPAGLAPPDVDGEGRVVREERAAAVVARVRDRDAAGRVVRALREEKSEASPPPYSLADLQIDAARRLCLTAKEVLDICQSLYETRRLVSYPRSDCSHLPEAQHADGKATLLAVAVHAPELAGLAASADLSLRSGAWDDRKVTAHHAIVPTLGEGAERVDLQPTERAVYALIARRYIAQFLPAHVYAITRLELDLAGERFVAVGRETLAEGWRGAIAAAGRASRPGDAAAGTGDDAEQAPELPPLADLREGQEVTITACDCVRRQTTPPKPFTDATLLAAMVNIAAHVDDPRVKTILSAADGLGTPATRPAILETLFERGYLERKGRAILSTAVGRALVASLPPVAATPDMTAEWEAAMRDIAEGRLSIEAFLARVTLQLGTLIEQGKARRAAPPPPPPHPDPSLPPVPGRACPATRHARRNRAPR